MAHIFKYSSYIKYLIDDIAARVPMRGYQRELAEAAGCAAPYLSSVLRGKCHLLPDHGFGLCQFWHFEPAQEEFFMLLLQHARASKRQYRTSLEARIKQKRQEYTSLAKRAVAAEHLDETDALIYYRHWSMAAIHVVTSISAYQTPHEIAAALLLPLAAVHSCLDQLVQLGLVTYTGTRYIRTEKSLHVSADSPLNSINHLNWRNKIVADGFLAWGQSFNYSAVFALSKEDYGKIRDELYGVFDRLQKIVATSSEETMAVICLDLAPMLRG